MHRDHEKYLEDISTKRTDNIDNLANKSILELKYYQINLEPIAGEKKTFTCDVCDKSYRCKDTADSLTKCFLLTAT